MSAGTISWTGTLLSGRYEVRAPLGEGGMASVYRAWDRNLETAVVVKSPHPSLLTDAQFAIRFQREVRALVSLTHPHVVKVLDVGEHERQPFAVLQFMAGGSLEKRIARGRDGTPKPVSLAAFAGWLPEVAEALDFVAARGVVHRDVKPANILFDDTGHAYLSDFGIVKALEGGNRQTRPGTVARAGLSLTQTGMLIGTPEYMAPELTLGEPFDARVDQYALGVLVYELLCGRRPYVGPTSGAILKQQLQGPPVAPRHVVPTIPPAASQIVLRALSQDPQQRFATSQDFVAALLAVSPPGASTRPASPRTHSPHGAHALLGTHSPAVSETVLREREERERQARERGWPGNAAATAAQVRAAEDRAAETRELLAVARITSSRSFWQRWRLGLGMAAGCAAALVVVGAFALLGGRKERPADGAAVVIEAVAESYENGEPRLSGSKQGDRQTGEWKAWHRGRVLWVSGRFGDSGPQGEWQYFDRSSRLVGRRVDGTKTGTWTEESADGEMSAEGKYVDGRPDGAWTFRRVADGRELLAAEIQRGVVRRLMIDGADRVKFHFDYDDVFRTVRCTRITYAGDTNPTLDKFDLSAEKDASVFKEVRTDGLATLVSRLVWRPSPGPFDPATDPREIALGSRPTKPLLDPLSPLEFLPLVELPSLYQLKKALADAARTAAAPTPVQPAPSPPTTPADAKLAAEQAAKRQALLTERDTLQKDLDDHQVQLRSLQTELQKLLAADVALVESLQRFDELARNYDVKLGRLDQARKQLEQHERAKAANIKESDSLPGIDQLKENIEIFKQREKTDSTLFATRNRLEEQLSRKIYLGNDIKKRSEGIQLAKTKIEVETADLRQLSAELTREEPLQAQRQKSRAANDEARRALTARLEKLDADIQQKQARLDVVRQQLGQP